MCDAPLQTGPLGWSSCHRSADRRRIKKPFVHGRKVLSCARLPAENHDDLSSWDERSILPRCHPHSAMPLFGQRVGLSGRLASGCPLVPPATPADWCCPLSLALCAGAYWRALEARGLVRRLTGPFALVAAPACTNRWFSTPAPGGTRPDHSPYWECGGSLRVRPGACQTGSRGLRCGCATASAAPRLAAAQQCDRGGGVECGGAEAPRHDRDAAPPPHSGQLPTRVARSPGWQLGEASN